MGKTYTVLFLYLKKNTYAFFNPTSKTHPRFFLPSKNTYAFLILNSRHIRVFGFDSKNTSAFFFSSKKTHARFFHFPKCETQKTQKNTKKTSRFQGLEPDPDPEELTQTQATSRFPFTAWLLLQSSSVKNIGNLPHSCI